ncbi:hypothetical protein F4678DRAFT_460752 [Xylaria arbuscula]|nr:hypothetical protein F4678DRAFT_460752 [Xylaria arbuscula]
MREASAKVRFAAETSDLFVYHPCWIDSLAHISGFVLNGTELTTADTVYISHGWKSMRIAVAKLSPTKTYLTYVRMNEDPKASTVMVGDVYVIEDGQMIGLIQDIKFRRIKRFQLEHFLPLQNNIGTAQVNFVEDEFVQHSEMAVIFDIITQEVGVEPEELADHVSLADMGVDSLLSLSIAARVKDVLELGVPSNLFLSSVIFGDLRNNLTDYYGLSTPSTEDDTTTASALTTSDAEETLDDDGDESPQQNGVAATKLSPGASTERAVLFLPPDTAGRASSYTWLAAVHFGTTGQDTIYGLDNPFVRDNAAMFGDISLNELVINRGVLAFEAASQLRDVSSLFLIDPPCPNILEERDRPGRLVHGFETAREIIDIATLVHGGNHSSRSNVQRLHADAIQAHFIGSMEMLGNYRPSPLSKLDLRATLLWARNGVLETLGQGSAEAVHGLL